MFEEEKKFRVLIVDDDELLRENLRLVVSTLESYEAFEAPDGYRALEILYKYPIDAILLDVNMPGLSGLEVLKMVRQAGYQVPVILMTGYPSIDLSVEALRNGATDFLIKPFTLEQFKNTLQKVREQQKDSSEDRHTKTLVRLLKQKIREQTVLFTISDRLTACRHLSHLYEEVLGLALKFTSSERGVLYLSDIRQGLLLPTVWEGFADSPPDLSLKDDSNPIVKACLENLPCISNNGNGFCLLVVSFSVKSEILGALALYRKRPFHQEDLFVVNLIAERASPLAENFILYESIFLNLHDSLRALVKALEAKDHYTKEHSERVTALALNLANHLGLSETEIESLRFAGHLHDIGKVGIQDKILLKPGRLTPEEYEVIKRHPLIGAEIVGHISLLRDEVLIIKHHHERWDGKGYPDGLAGEEIPFLARILAVADTYDAMTSNRPYRPPLSHEVALREIRQNSGTQFDPLVVEAFLDLWVQKERGKYFHEKSLSEFVA